MAKEAPDFWSWRSGVFEADTGSAREIAPVYDHGTLDWYRALLNLTTAQKRTQLEVLLETLGEIDRQSEESAASRKDDIFHLCLRIAALSQSLGEIDEAERHAQRALETAEKGSLAHGRAWRLLADLYAFRGNLDEALRIFQEESLPVYEEFGDIEGEAASLYRIAGIDLLQGNLQAALEGMSRSYELLRQHGQLNGICVVGLDLGRLLLAAGRPEEAHPLLVRSRDGFRKLGRDALARQVEAVLEQIPTAEEDGAAS